MRHVSSESESEGENKWENGRTGEQENARYLARFSRTLPIENASSHLLYILSRSIFLKNMSSLLIITPP